MKLEVKNKDLFIGCHVGLSGPDYYLGTVKEALSYGANTFMFYTGAPQNTFRKPTNQLNIVEGRKLLQKEDIDEGKIIVHAPYLINLGNMDNEKFHKSIMLLQNELKRTADFGVKIFVLHPGSSLEANIEESLNQLIKGLDYVLDNDKSDVKIALETMSGKGSELGVSFEQFKYIFNHCKNKERIGICLDTCHLFDNGYNLDDIDKFLNTITVYFPIDKVLCIHINDSKNLFNSHKDRHENIGYGNIGFDTLYNFVHHPLLAKIPKILETPYINSKPPYKQEIIMLKNRKYIDNWKDSL